MHCVRCMINMHYVKSNYSFEKLAYEALRRSTFITMKMHYVRNTLYMKSMHCLRKSISIMMKMHYVRSTLMKMYYVRSTLIFHDKHALCKEHLIIADY